MFEYKVRIGRNARKRVHEQLESQQRFRVSSVRVALSDTLNPFAARSAIDHDFYRALNMLSVFPMTKSGHLRTGRTRRDHHQHADYVKTSACGCIVHHILHTRDTTQSVPCANGRVFAEIEKCSLGCDLTAHVKSRSFVRLRKGARLGRCKRPAHFWTAKCRGVNHPQAVFAFTLHPAFMRICATWQLFTSAAR